MKDRQKRAALGSIQPPIVEVTDGLRVLDKSNPFSDRFELAVGPRTKDLMNCLVAMQKRTYHRTILEQLDFRTCQRHVKLLLEKYPAPLIVRGIALACVRSSFPFSFRFVEEMIEQWLKESTMSNSLPTNKSGS